LAVLTRGLRVALVAVLLASFNLAYSQDKQNIPDAPSAVQPPQQFPNAAPEPKEQPRPEEPPAPEPTPPPPGTEQPAEKAPASDSSPEAVATSRDDLPNFVSRVNFVQVPVTVKDQDGRMVNGLLPRDFEVFENGEKQKMTFFTSDPFPLSAAVVFDLGMPDTAVQKVNQTLTALQGAFSQFDEVSLYSYSGTVSQITSFASVGQQMSDTLAELKTKRGANSGVPVVSGPLGPQGPIINNRPVDPRVPTVVTPPRESHVINDAILAAALDLSKRERSRRKIIFVISNGREYGSKASYSDVLKVLLTNGIVVYGLEVGSAKIPGYGSLQKLHVPRFGTGDILPKYASASGGEVFSEFSTQDIGDVYARAMGDARNQYTLGYVSRAARTGSYREIEVRVARPDCTDYAAPCVRTYAKAGYYPTPPAVR
jgi:VWFA-related protein